MFKKIFLGLFILICSTLAAQAQSSQPCQWNYSFENGTATATYCGNVKSNGSLETLSSVNTEQALSQLSGHSNESVLRLGYYTPGDAGGGVIYTFSPAACSKPDNGAQVSAPNGCWIAQFTANSYNVAVWGAKLDWNGASNTGTANQTAILAAINYACSISNTGGLYDQAFPTVTDGGIPEGISAPILVQSCPGGANLNLSLHALASYAGDIGDASTVTRTFITPNVNSGLSVVAGLWNPHDIYDNPLSTWGQQNVSAISNDGTGQVELTVTSASGITTGQLVAVWNASGLLSINTSWIVTVPDATHIILNGSIFSSGYTGGAVMSAALPQGMITLAGNAAISFEHSVFDCEQTTDAIAQSSCVPLTLANMTNFRNTTEIDKSILENFSGPGLFVYGAGTAFKTRGGIIRGGLFGQCPSGRTSFGVYIADGSADDYVQDETEIQYNYQNFYTESNAPDFHIRTSHLFSGCPFEFGTGFGPVYPSINGTFGNSGSYTDTTTDSGSTFVLGSGTGFPNVVFSGDTSEFFNNSVQDASVVYRDLSSHVNFHTTSLPPFNMALVPFGPSQFINPNNQNTISGNINGTIEAVDNQGIADSWVYQGQSLSQIAALNSQTGDLSFPKAGVTTLSTGNAAYTATASLVTGSYIVTNVSWFPNAGDTLTDSGGCLPSSAPFARVGLASLQYNLIGLTTDFTPTTNCASDTITDTATGQTWTGTISGTGANPRTITAVSFPLFWYGMGISGTGIPAGSWVSGFTPYYWTGTKWTSAIQFENVALATGTNGSATATGSETLTFAPASYSLTPQANGAILCTYGSASYTIPVLTMFAGYNVHFCKHGTSSLILAPQSALNINGVTNPSTLTMSVNAATLMQDQFNFMGFTQ